MQPELLRILACPKCKKTLRQKGDDALACTTCKLKYPLRNGVPYLMTQDARKI